MKTARLFLGVVLSSCVLFVVACTGNDSTQQCKDEVSVVKGESAIVCEKTGKTVVACCNGSQCKYEVDPSNVNDETVFACKQSDCKDAAEKVTAYCSGH
jgi:hypothetical protein